MKSEILKEKESLPELTFLPTAKLQPNFKNPFTIRNEDMRPLEESISEYGVLEPLLVRRDDKADVYILISGHRRLLAANRLGITELPVRIFNITEDEANIMMVDSNSHREKIYPSEKAYAYKLKMGALSHQGKTSSQLATKSDTATEIGKAANESRDQVFRFIRLVNLIPELMKMVDDDKIALNPAVEISYLTKEEQKNLLITIESEDATPSLSQAKSMKKASQEGSLTMDDIFSIMTKPKANQKEVIKIQTEKYDKYFGNLKTPKEKEKFISDAIEYYAKYLARYRKRNEAELER